MKKKIFAITIILATLIGGCAPTATSQLRDAQTNEILMLQDVKRQILLRPAYTAQARLAKAADLKEVNRQIEMALQIQREAQATSNQRTDNAISTAVTGAAIVGGAAWGIHELAK